MALNPAELNLPALMEIREFARLVGLSETTIRRCVNQTKRTTDKGWPPLAAKRLPDGQLRIPANAAAAWINALEDA